MNPFAHLEESLSASRIGTYLRCPLRYYFQYIERLEWETGIRFSIACKQPRREAGIVRSARDAREQIVRAGSIGVVAISLDHLVNRLVADPSGSPVTEECGKRIDDVMGRSREAVFDALRRAPPRHKRAGDPEGLSGVLGAVITGSFFYLARHGASGPTYVNTGLLIRYATIAQDTRAMEFIARSVEQGDKRFAALDLEERGSS